MAKATARSTQETLERISAAAVDGRTLNVRYRQNQLHLLHAYCRKNADSIRQCMIQDKQVSPAEADLQFYMTMACINQHYASLRFEAALKDEYSVSREKDNKARRIPYAIALIRPSVFSRLFSAIAPFAAAIAAGNCVVLELQNTLSQMDDILRGVVSSLDLDAYVLVTSTINDPAFLARCIVIDQNSSAPASAQATCISDPNQPVLAVVDRSADIELAAQNICNARTAFGGSSPYAPDIILVNEFVRKPFVEACVRYLTSAAATLAFSGGSKVRQQRKEDRPDPGEGLYNVLFDTGSVALLEAPNVGVQQRHRIRGSKVVFTSITGLVDGITCARKWDRKLAFYAFAEPAAAKFLDQHVDAQSCWVNQIPPYLLVGPAAPSTPCQADPFLRYTTEMLSRSSPVYFSMPIEAGVIDLLADSTTTPSKTGKALTLGEMRLLALKPLPPTNQASGSSAGFFDQGIITGAVAFVLPSVALTGYAMFRVVSFAIRKYAGVPSA